MREVRKPIPVERMHGRKPIAVIHHTTCYQLLRGSLDGERRGPFDVNSDDVVVPTGLIEGIICVKAIGVTWSLIMHTYVCVNVLLENDIMLTFGPSDCVVVWEPPDVVEEKNSGKQEDAE